jgi:hypothetical protein
MQIAFALFDVAGTPLAGAAPTFTQYRSAITGTDLSGSAPAITEISAGIYAFTPADADLADEGVAFFIDGGVSSVPQYLGGGQGDNGVVVLPFFATDGSPGAGCAATLDTYENTVGGPLTPPTLNNLGPDSGLFSFVPAAGDLSARAAYMVSSDAEPTRYFGQLEAAAGGGGGGGSPPVVSGVNPAPGTPIAAGTALGFDVTDDVAFRRILVTIYFPTLGRAELAHDGNGFLQQYGLSRRSNIAGGFRYSVVRTGGWPATPRLLVYATNVVGLED